MRRLTNTNHSDTRRNKILDAVVRLYVHDVEPVASGTICRRFRTGLSPASVRHVMAELEEMGYIQQPHTSAGRVPTERGYRHYVNAIMEPERLAPSEQALIESQLIGTEHDLESLMEAAAEMLAGVTHLMGVVLFPRAVRDSIRHIEVVNLSPSRVMIVWLLNSGVLRNVVVSVEEPLENGLAQRITNFANDQLHGASLDGLADLLTRRLIAEEGSLFYIMQQAMDLLQRGLRQVIDDRVAYDGASWMLAQPEFQDPLHVSPLLQTLEDRRSLLAVLESAAAGSGGEVSIGHEIPLEPMQGCSLVAASYAVDGQPVGAVAVLGPTRMAYPKVMAVTQRVAAALSRVLTEASGQGSA
jgi:heat-inducible transcriptional repressor